MTWLSQRAVLIHDSESTLFIHEHFMRAQEYFVVCIEGQIYPSCVLHFPQPLVYMCCHSNKIASWLLGGGKNTCLAKGALLLARLQLSCMALVLNLFRLCSQKISLLRNLYIQGMPEEHQCSQQLSTYQEPFRTLKMGTRLYQQRDIILHGGWRLMSQKIKKQLP